MTVSTQHHTAVVIGSGFGGAMTALPIARAFARRNKGETLLMLERGTWWTTPVSTVQDKEVKTYDFLRDKKQPVQYWSSAEHFRGLIDIVLRCVRRDKNEDGLYDLTTFGRSGFLGLFGGKTDGVTILHANGVGGGSLVYANVTIQPPDFIFDDPRWPIDWKGERNVWFDLARDAIGYGVVYALEQREHPIANPADPASQARAALKVNSGLSNIVTRSARLDPHWDVAQDPATGRAVKRIKNAPGVPPAKQNRLWIDRARVFQTAMQAITNDYGTVDSSINDVTPEPGILDPAGKPANYCERQGRCIIGCLPGARHTLNKQLMAAIHGKPDGTPALYPKVMSLEALAEVEFIRARPQGGYEIHYMQRDADKPWKTTRRVVTADKVIVAAGCVGTNEIMLRSRAKGGLPNLSDTLGFGFSTNGDYLAFLDGIRERVSLTRGPVTTSFGHFNTPGAHPDSDPAKFLTIEDNGIPRAFSFLAGSGVPMLRSLGKGWPCNSKLFLAFTLILWLVKRLPQYVRALFLDDRVRQDILQSEDEWTENMMCIAGIGRDAAVGQFRLGGKRGETTLRVSRTDGKEFYQDPIYDAMREKLDLFAGQLTDDDHKGRTFFNPFLKLGQGGLAAPIALSHPLGGCRMARSADEGVADEYGRVFDATKRGERPFYEGLYLADASIIPTALGVNPSLTIAALALRIADNIVAELSLASDPLPADIPEPMPV